MKISCCARRYFIASACVVVALALAACQSAPMQTALPTSTLQSSATSVPPTGTSTSSPATATPQPTSTATLLPPDVPLYQLAYVDETGGLRMINSDGSGDVAIVEPSASVEFHGVDWSAAAGLFALTGAAVDSSNIVTPTVFTLRLDGSGLTKLFTPPPASAATYGWRVDDITEIHWSANGKWLVFSSDRSQGSGGGGGTPNLHRISAKGAGFETFPQFVVAGDAAWAPRGNVVAYADGIAPDIFGIRVTDFDSGKTTTIKSIPLNAGDGCGQPAWSPDGTRLSFMCEVDKQGSLYVVNVDDSAPLKLDTGIQDYRQWSAWSPDGTWIAYTDGDDLLMIRPDGSEKRNLQPGKGGGPIRWSPDGTRLAFYKAGDLYVIFADGRYLKKIASGLAWRYGDTMFTWISGKLP